MSSNGRDEQGAIGSAPSGDDVEWGALDAGDVAERLDVDVEQGLSDDEAVRRLDDVGPNRIERVPQDPAWRLFVDQFRSPLIVLLLAAAAVGAVGQLRDAVVIAAVLILNAVLGFVQEFRAQKSMAALREMLTFTARVRRGGKERECDGADLAPGDVVLVSAGERVPADGRLVEAEHLSANESTLTGESTPVDKHPEPVEAGAPLAERASELFMGTSVARGRAVIVVTSTGMASEMGRIWARMHEQEGRQSPLKARLTGLAARLSTVAVLAAALVVGVSMLRGDPFGEALIDGVVLAVASTRKGCRPSSPSPWRSACGPWRAGARWWRACGPFTRWGRPRRSAPTRRARSPSTR